jgi:hypothetical protein
VASKLRRDFINSGCKDENVPDKDSACGVVDSPDKFLTEKLSIDGIVDRSGPRINESKK